MNNYQNCESYDHKVFTLYDKRIKYQFTDNDDDEW